MSDADITALAHAIIGLLSAITVLITLYNHDRLSKLGDKVDNISQGQLLNGEKPKDDGSPTQ